MFHLKPFCYNHISPGFLSSTSILTFALLFSSSPNLYPLFPLFFAFFYWLLSLIPSEYFNSLLFFFHLITYSLPFFLHNCFSITSSIQSLQLINCHPSHAYHANPTFDIADVSIVSQHLKTIYPLMTCTTKINFKADRTTPALLRFRSPQ